jgi:mRNA-degrading endonuclease RelE of RelBE toxin-antitoxin system
LFELTISQRSKKSSKKLLDHQKHRILEFLLVLRENPVPAEQYDIKKLGGYKDTFRARIGDIRVIYEVQWTKQAITVLVIERRETAYST